MYKVWKSWEVAALPQHHQEYPWQYHQSPVTHVPWHQVIILNISSFQLQIIWISLIIVLNTNYTVSICSTYHQIIMSFLMKCHVKLFAQCLKNWVKSNRVLLPFSNNFNIIHFITDNFYCFSRNQLSYLPASISCLVNLQCLVANNNKLVSLPEEIGKNDTISIFNLILIPCIDSSSFAPDLTNFY